MIIQSFPQSHTQCQNILVIGYGNELCGDDAVGPYIAKIIASWEADHVSAIAVPQLTPELAANIKESSCVIFIDAAHETLDMIRIKPLHAEALVPGLAPACTFGYACTPATLLALSQLLYGNPPHAWMIEIPATNFQLGQAFSHQTEVGIQAALVEMEQILRQGALCQIRPMAEAV